MQTSDRGQSVRIDFCSSSTPISASAASLINRFHRFEQVFGLILAYLLGGVFSTAW